MRQSYDCRQVNNPKTIAGLEWKLVVATVFFFGMAVVLYRAPGVLVMPAIVFIFLRGPGKKDALFIRIYLRHRVQRTHYSPAYITAKNASSPRPVGFSRLMTF
jgi:type IV secretory pathway TrbD component